MRRAGVAAAIALLAGCGASDSSSPEAEPAPATLRFEHSISPEGPMYIEGAIYHITLAQADSQVDDRTIEFNGTLTLELPSGTYTVGSYAEVCNGNCGSLGPPTDHCSIDAEFEDGASRTASIVARPGGCTIELD